MLWYFGIMVLDTRTSQHRFHSQRSFLMLVSDRLSWYFATSILSTLIILWFLMLWYFGIMVLDTPTDLCLSRSSFLSSSCLQASMARVIACWANWNNLSQLKLSLTTKPLSMIHQHFHHQQHQFHHPKFSCCCLVCYYFHSQQHSNTD